MHLRLVSAHHSVVLRMHAPQPLHKLPHGEYEAQSNWGASTAHKGPSGAVP